jgi:transcriptional regulator with XRE-family HTH domain
MTKRHIMKPAGKAGACGGGNVWSTVGRQLARRRRELGYGAEHVANGVDVTIADYLEYENGAPIPAFLLGQLAELLDRPVTWFFEGLIPAPDAEGETGPDHVCATYKVATIEHRIETLTESFRKLDFEGQQHLLAISRALSRANAGTAQE